MSNNEQENSVIAAADRLAAALEASEDAWAQALALAEQLIARARPTCAECEAPCLAEYQDAAGLCSDCARSHYC